MAKEFAQNWHCFFCRVNITMNWKWATEMLIKLQGFRGDKWNYCSGQNIITKYFLNDLVQSVKIMNTWVIRAENCKHLQILISFRKFHFYNAKMLHWYIKLILSSSANCLQSKDKNFKYKLPSKFSDCFSEIIDCEGVVAWGEWSQF